MKVLFTLLIGTASVLTAGSASALNYKALRAPVSGHVTSAQNSLSAVSSSRGFANVDNQITALQNRYGDSLLAIGSERYEGKGTVHTTNFYVEDASGAFRLVASVIGETFGGDEFELSQPGNVRFLLVE